AKPAKPAKPAPLLGTADGRGRLRPEDSADRGTQRQAAYAFLDVNDTILEVHGHQKQGAGLGYSGSSPGWWCTTVIH
ncbi:MAG: hypothetical protein ABI112_14350, partial [Terracoccus sp.]